MSFLNPFRLHISFLQPPGNGISTVFTTLWLILIKSGIENSHLNLFTLYKMEFDLNWIYDFVSEFSEKSC